MKKLLLPLLLIVSAGSVHAMFWRKGGVPKTPAPKLEKPRATPEEVFLIATLNLGDVEGLKKLIAEKKVDVNEPLKLEFYEGKTPIEIIFEYQTPNKLQIAQVLLDAGAIDADGKAKAAIEGAKGNLSRLQELAKTAYEKALAAFGAQQEPVKVEQAVEKNTPEIAVQEPLQVELEGEKVERIAPVVFTPIIHYPTRFTREQEPQAAKKKVILTPKTTPKPAAARVQEVKVEITPAAKPAVTKQLVRPVPVSRPAPAQAPAPVTKAPAVPVNPAPATAKWPSRPAPMRPVQQVPVSVLEEHGVPTAKPVEELQIIGAR